MPHYTALAYLSFSGDFDALELSEMTALQPCSRMQRHHLDEKRKIPEVSTLHYGQVESFEAIPDIYDLADSVVAKLSNYQHEIVAMTENPDCEVTFQVVLYFPVSEETSTPIIGFSRSALAFINELGASIDIDTYRI